MKTIFMAGALGLLAFSALSEAKTVNVLVWDKCFAANDPAWPQEPNLGKLGEVFTWDRPCAVEDSSGKRDLHGLQVSYILAKDLPEAVVHRVHDSFLPWQDPELCDLTGDDVFAQALRSAGHSALPKCRDQAQRRIQDLKNFIRKKTIRLVNISHGTAYRAYVLRNPLLLHKTYPGVKMTEIDRFLEKNFKAIGEIVEPLFRDLRNVTFVVAAGNNGDIVEQTYYGSFASKYENVIAVAASYDGEKLAERSNYGAVDFAKHVGRFLVPDEKGMAKFDGTSAAAAETSRLYLQAFMQAETLSPADFKRMSRNSVTPKAALTNQVGAGGILEDSAFLNAVAKSLGAANTIRPSVIKKQARLMEYTLPPDLFSGQNGCHSLVVANDGLVWMTLSWANMVISFDPAKNVFTRYPLPTPKGMPDGIALDKAGRLWFGIDTGLGMIDPANGTVTEFPHAQHRPFNITAVAGDGAVWATSHQSQFVNRYDPASKIFSEFKVKTSWPLDIRVDDQGSVWATGLSAFDASGTGALIQIESGSDQPKYFPLPKPAVAGKKAYEAEWVAASQEKVVVTTASDGFFLFDKKTHSFNHIQPNDHPTGYWISRAATTGEFFLLNTKAGHLSVDRYNPQQPDVLHSYIIPEGGHLRESLDFDSAGDVWFCRSYTDRFGKLVL